MKEFKAHWTSHKEKNHKCNVCESSFNKIVSQSSSFISISIVCWGNSLLCKQLLSLIHSFQKNLILHEALHKVNITTCPLDSCRKEFKRFASLKAHLKTHEEEETLTCTKCGEEFTNQVRLIFFKYHPRPTWISIFQHLLFSVVFGAALQTSSSV